jgi:uncharacterized protein (UPF0332 family)
VTDETRTLIRYRLERAEEALQEALLLLESGHANTCVNRLYYACFYAVSALLLAKGLSSARHSGERALFHQHIVKPGLLDVPLGQLYDKFFDNRQKGDYADLIRFAVPEIRPWLDEARAFVTDVAGLIQQEVEGLNPSED